MSDTWTPGAAFSGATGGAGGVDPVLDHYRDVGNRVRVLTQTSPWIAQQPDVLMALAQDATLDTFDLASQSAALTGRMRVDALATSLGTMTPAAQRMVWSRLTTTQQAALTDMGYSTPQQDRGTFDFLNPVGEVIGQGIGVVGSAVGAVAMPLLEGLTWVGDRTAHLHRAFESLSRDQQAVGLGLGLGAIIGYDAADGNPTDWWDAFNSTWDGERVFTREAQAKARELLGDDAQLVNLAADIGWEDDPYELLVEFAGVRDSTSEQQLLRSVDRVASKLVDPQDPQYRAVTERLVQLTDDENFRQAVQTLQDGKISPGRSLARSVGLSPNGGWYNVVSGAGDGAWLVFMDPTLVGGKAAKINKARRFGVEITGNQADDVGRIISQIESTPAVRRHYDVLAEAVSTGDFATAKQILPGSQNLWGDLTSYRDKLAREGRLAGGFRREHIYRWVEDGAGYEAMLRGRMAVQGESKLLLPSLSRTGIGWARAKRYGEAVINFADDNNSLKTMRKVVSELEADLRLTQRTATPGAVAAASDVAQPAFRHGQRTVNQAEQYARTKRVLDVIDSLPVLGKMERTFGALAGSATNMIPPTRAISLVGPGATTDIDKFVDLGRVMGMTSDTRNAWRNFILDQTNPGLRASAIESYLDTLLRVSGVDALPEGEKIIRRFLTKTHQSYALGGLDELVVGGRQRMTGVLPAADQAVELVMPDLRELRRAVQKGAIFHYLLDAADAKYIDAAMTKVWKPAVLLRIGFIPRAAGEELLAMFARTGVSQFLADRAQVSIAQGKLADPGYFQRVSGKALMTEADYNIIEHWKVMAHVRPLERIFARFDWTKPGVRFLEGYSRIVRNALEDGLISDGLLARMSDNSREMLLGNERSLRRLLLAGADENVAEAVEAFQARFADSIMRQVGAQNAGLLDRGQRNVVHVLTGGGEDPQAYVMSRGEWRTYDKGDELYNVAYHHQLQRAVGDPVVAQAILDPYTRARPMFADLDTQTAQGLAKLYSEVDPEGLVGRVLREGLDGAPMTAIEYDRLLTELSYGLDAAQMDELLAILPTSQATAEEVLDALVTVGGGVADEFRPALMVLDSLSGLGADSRGWAQAFLEHGRWSLDDLDNLDAWFVDNVDDMIRTNIAALMTDPKNQEVLRTSLFAVETPDGAVVRNAIPDDTVRLYQPTLTQDDLRTLNNVASRAARQHAAAAPEDQAELLDLLAGDILQGWGVEMSAFSGRLGEDAYDVVHDFARSLILRAGDGTLDDLLASAQAVGHVPLSFYAFDDPEIAKAVGFYLKRRNRQSLVRSRDTPVAYVDFDRAMKSGKLPQVTKRTRTGARNGWSTDHRAVRPELVPADAEFEQIAGQWVHGTSVEQSAQQWADVVTERLNQIVRSDGLAEMRASRPLRYEIRRRNRATETVTVNPGQRLAKDRVYFDAETGEKVKWADRAYMTAREVEKADGRLMWEILGPALRDAGDEVTGGVLYGPGGERIFRSKLDHIANANADLPQWAIDVSMKPLEQGKWDKFVQFGWDEVISPSIDAIVRKPMALHYFIDSYTQARKATRWLLDSSIIDDQLPRVMGEVFSGYAARGGDDFMQAVREGIDLFDHDLSKLSDTQVARYIADLSDAELDRLKARARHRLAQDVPNAGRQVAAINAIRNADPDLLALFARGDDPNLAFARMLVDKVGPSINVSWATAQRHKRIQALVEEYPGLEQVMANGGWDLIRAARDNIEHVDQLVGDIAVERTVSSAMQFVDSHEIKSQMSEYGRNLVPFWYAEENFIKRWARTLRISPEAIRKGQLTYMGLKEVGVVRTDDQGRDWFVYPGSGPFIDAIGRVPGLGALPIGAMFQAETQTMLPGFDRFGQPSPSPLVGVPLTAVSQMFPELRPLHEGIAGRDGLYRGIARQVIPTTAMRTWEAFFANANNSTTYASSMMAAAAYMEASGQGLPDAPTAEEVDTYMRRLEKHARTIGFAKALVGFVVPGSPRPINTGDPSVMENLTGIGVEDPAQLLRTEYYTLIRQAGIEEGTRLYMERFPDHGLEDIVNPLAVTVSQSETPSGARLPATEQAVAFYDEHEEWMASMPNAGPWLLPPDIDSTDRGDDYAYTRQTIDGLRQRRTPEEYLRAIKFKEGATTYFKAQDERDRMIEAARAMGDTTRAQMIQEQWSQWADIFIAQHPIFGDELVSTDGQERRRKVLEELRVAVGDPEAPQAWHFGEVRAAVQMFDAYRGAIAAIRLDRSAEGQARREYIKAGYEEAMARFVVQYPHVESLWLTILRPEADL